MRRKLELSVVTGHKYCMYRITSPIRFFFKCSQVWGCCPMIRFRTLSFHWLYFYHAFAWLHETNFFHSSYRVLGCNALNSSCLISESRHPSGWSCTFILFHSYQISWNCCESQLCTYVNAIWLDDMFFRLGCDKAGDWLWRERGGVCVI